MLVCGETTGVRGGAAAESQHAMRSVGVGAREDPILCHGCWAQRALFVTVAVHSSLQSSLQS